MKLKAVLGIKSLNNKEIKKYRIINENNEIRDASLEKIKEVLSQGITIEGLQLSNNEIIETTEIPNIPELRKCSISLYDWCLQNGERGQRILTEFNNGDNFPITAKDISFSSHIKVQFRCTICHKINIQTISNKTSTSDNKCKYCAGRENVGSGITLQDWCNTHGTYGAQLIQEFIAGDNDFKPDQILYASNKYAKFRCNKCGNINNQIIANKTRKNPIGCKYCGTVRTSFGEQLIYLWLLSQGLEVYNQYKIQTPLGTKEFDIYIPALNLAIEHQSGRHATTEMQFCDNKTELIAQQLGLNLLEICQIDSRYPRTENQWCITYKYRNEQEMITKLSNWFNTNYKLNTNPNYPRALEDQAYLNSCKVTYEQSLQFKNTPFLKEWNYQLNGSITPDKVSLNSHRKYYWTCPICGHIYLSSPDKRNSGRACPNYRNHNKY